MLVLGIGLFKKIKYKIIIFILKKLNIYLNLHLPVPSYPLTVELIIKLYGPNIFFTNGIGMAAASSTKNKSA
jgi:hypothetical protein